MNVEMALFGFKVVLVLKGIFALAALLEVIVMAIWEYKRMTKVRKAQFWATSALAVFAMLWVTTMFMLLAYPHLARLIPELGWYILIFGSPTAALAAGLSVGLYSSS